jgi:dihydroneopterin aldolase
MQDLAGKTAFITGGASGLGLAMAHAFGAAGMNVMLADIEAEPLARAVAELEARQVRVAAVQCDVTDRAALVAAAREIAAGGHIDLVETFAERLAEACIGQGAAQRVRVCVLKPHALAPEADAAGVELVLEMPAK